jgi:hypothetical protein
MFNLKQHIMHKMATYEGVQGYFVSQTRAWQNCVCSKQKENKSPQDAWDECLGEYQKSSSNLDWVKKHLPGEDSKTKKTAQQMSGGAQLQMGSYWGKIQKNMKKGMTTGQAVMKALDDCRKEADSIPEK